jgi:hypothetical protein
MTQSRALRAGRFGVLDANAYFCDRTPAGFGQLVRVGCAMAAWVQLTPSASVHQAQSRVRICLGPMRAIDSYGSTMRFGDISAHPEYTSMEQTSHNVIAALDLSDLPEGEILRTLEPLSAAETAFLASWETPLIQWGGFRVNSDIVLESPASGPQLRFPATRSGAAERVIATGGEWLRDCCITTTFEPVGTEAQPHVDRDACRQSLAGIVFRMQTSRWYYQFAVEGRSRVVLYRRRDDEWHVLAHQDVVLPHGPITLQVELDGDGMRASCHELDVDILATDTMFTAGKAGYRTLGGSVLHDLCVTRAPWQERRNAARAAMLTSALAGRSCHVPDAVLVDTLDLEALGGTPTFADFAEPGRFDMLVTNEQGLRALDACGEEIWRVEEPVRNPVLSRTHDGDGGRLIYAFTGQRKIVDRASVSGDVAAQAVQNEMVVIRGGDGVILARAQLPVEKGDMRFFDWSPESAALQDPAGFDIVLREWREDMGGGGCRLWALDRNLNQLWFHQQEGAYYGHHWALAFHDIDGDGRDELLAGGHMYSNDGRVLWRHDRADEMWGINGAQHYDAVALGALSADPGVDPVAFLMGGSAGVYVVDAQTGQTRAVHRIGHAQGRVICNLREDMPGDQVIAVTRWGNFGIITLLAGDGSRLWTIQPDYVGQGCAQINWAGRNLLWTNTSRQVQALYDGFGRQVKALTELTRAYGDGPRMTVSATVVRRGREPRELLALGSQGKLRLFGPDA